MWLPTRQDGFQNRDKAFFVRLMCVSLRSKQRQKDSVASLLFCQHLNYDLVIAVAKCQREKILSIRARCSISLEMS